MNNGRTKLSPGELKMESITNGMETLTIQNIKQRCLSFKKEHPTQTISECCDSMQCLFSANGFQATKHFGYNERNINKRNAAYVEWQSFWGRVQKELGILG